MGCLACPLTRTVTLRPGKVSHACPVVSCSSPRYGPCGHHVHIRCSLRDHMIRSDCLRNLSTRPRSTGAEPNAPPSWRACQDFIVRTAAGCGLRVTYPPMQCAQTVRCEEARSYCGLCNGFPRRALSPGLAGARLAHSFTLLPQAPALRSLRSEAERIDRHRGTSIAATIEQGFTERDRAVIEARVSAPVRRAGG